MAGKPVARRKFFSRAAASLSAAGVAPALLKASGANDRVVIGVVGTGGRGTWLMEEAQRQGCAIAALCDVYELRMDWAQEKVRGRKPKRFREFEKLLEEKDIDAVIVSTPDHTHAVTAATAITMGKHVYVQKPLTHSVYESRLLAKLARKYKVATQMGNQGNSGEGIRQVTEWVQAGVIGKVKKAYAWTNRPIWPQGLERPKDTPPVPDTLRWDLFIGPAPDRPYNPIYHPWNWRGWWDYGTGALGDMANHIMDPIFKALELKYPYKVTASSTQINTESAPHAEIVHYVFPARGDQPEVEVSWYDGGLLPPRPEELPDGELMGRDWNGGCLFIGEKGKIMTGCYGKDPILLPYSRMKDFTPPPKKLRRPEETTGLKWGNGAHEQDWIRACKESPESRVLPSSNFDYAGPLNEMVVMGVVAVRLQDLKRWLMWDGENMRFTNISDSDKIRVVTTDSFKVVDGDPKWNTQYATINAKEAAEEYIKHTYHNGYSLPDMPA